MASLGSSFLEEISQMADSTEMQVFQESTNSSGNIQTDEASSSDDDISQMADSIEMQVSQESTNTTAGNIQTDETWSSDDDNHVSKKARIEKSAPPCSLQEYISYKHVEKLISKPFLFDYFSATVNDIVVQLEYGSFLRFIDKLPEPGRTQLTELVFPVFVHFILLLVRNSEISGAKNNRFYDLFSRLFVNDEGYKDAVKELHSLKTVDDVFRNNNFSKFWKMKYVIYVSYDVLQNLRSFLKEKECTLLSNILRFHFHFENLDFTLLNFADLKIIDENEDTEKERGNQDCITDPSLWKSIASDYIKKIVITCNSCSSLDVNEDATQVSLAHSCPFISVANLQEPKMSELQKQTISVKSEEQTLVDNYFRGSLKTINFPEQVNAVKYIPGIPDKMLVSSGTEVNLLNSLTGDVISTFESTHTNSIMDIDINSSVVLFVTASKDSTVCLYSFHKTKAIKTYLGHLDCINVIRFHPNGIYFATGASDSTVRLWDLETNYSLRSFVGHKCGVYCIAFSPDGKMLASADLFGIIRVWDINNNCTISEIPCYETFDHNLSKVTSLCFNHSSSVLAACNLKGIFRLYNVYARERYTKLFTTMHFQRTPLLIKCINSVWIMVLRENTQ